MFTARIVPARGTGTFFEHHGIGEGDAVRFWQIVSPLRRRDNKVVAAVAIQVRQNNCGSRLFCTAVPMEAGRVTHHDQRPGLSPAQVLPVLHPARLHAQQDP